MKHFLRWADGWALKSRPPFTAIIKLGRARTYFYITPIVFVIKKKVIYTYEDDLRLSKLWGNFRFFGVNYPFKGCK